MEFLLTILLLSGCAKSIPGNWNLVQCGSISGCDVEWTYKTKESCESMLSQMKDHSLGFGYSCEEVK